MTMPLIKAISFSARQRILLSNICKKSPKIIKILFEAAACLTPTNRVNMKHYFHFYIIILEVQIFILFFIGARFIKPKN